MRKSDYILGFAALAMFISGCEGCDKDERAACDCEVQTTIEGGSIVSPSSPTGSISNYAHDGDFTADAACHAEMVIYFEWVDSARAATQEVPPIVPSFETPLGYFPSSEVRERKTIVNGPNGAYTHYGWAYFTIEAQDKDTPQGTSYEVRWTYGASSAPAGNVRVLASLKSRVYDPNEYTRTNLSECAD